MPSPLKKAVEIVLGGTTEAKESFGVGQAVAGVDDRTSEAGSTGLAFGVQTNEG